MRNLGADLEAVADDETIEARLIADTNQALPAEEAVSAAPKRAPRGAPLAQQGQPDPHPARRSDRGR